MYHEEDVIKSINDLHDIKKGVEQLILKLSCKNLKG